MINVDWREDPNFGLQKFGQREGNGFSRASLAGWGLPRHPARLTPSSLQAPNLSVPFSAF